MPATDMQRCAALIAAALHVPEGEPRHKVYQVADLMLVEYLAPVSDGSLVIRASTFTYQQGGNPHPAGTTWLAKPDGSNTVELQDTQQVTLSVEAQDSKGYDTTDSNLTWSESSGGANLTLQPADDGMSALAVAGAPADGVVVTVSDGTRSGTISIDVKAGDAATLNVTAGTPEDQPAAPSGNGGTTSS